MIREIEVKEMSNRNTAQFRASTGEKQGYGLTPREALEELMEHLPPAPTAPIIILPFNQGDAFFTSVQQDRLQELKARHKTLSPEEEAELEGLLDACFDATVARTQALPRVKP